MDIRLITNNILDKNGMHFSYHTQDTVSKEMHYHEFYEIFVCYSGSIKHIINDSSHILNKCSLTFIRPNDVHCYKKISQKLFYGMNLAFDKGIYKQLNEYFLYELDDLFNNSKIPISINVPEQKDIHNIFETKNFMYYNNKNTSNLRITIFEFIKLFLFQNFNKQETNNWFDIMIDNLQNPKVFTNGVCKLCEITGKTQEHISRVFRERLNITPTEYVNNMKLNYAQKLLKTTQYSIIDVSQEAGFNNLSHFYHIFKKKYKMTPGNYRKNNMTTI